MCKNNHVLRVDNLVHIIYLLRQGVSFASDRTRLLPYNFSLAFVVHQRRDECNPAETQEINPTVTRSPSSATCACRSTLALIGSVFCRSHAGHGICLAYVFVHSSAQKWKAYDTTMLRTAKISFSLNLI